MKLKYRLDKYDAGLNLVLNQVGGPAALARALGLTNASVSNWRTIPPKHVGPIANITGITPDQLRPDLFSEGQSPSGQAAA